MTAAPLTIQQLQDILATAFPTEQEYLKSHAVQIAHQLIATMQREADLMATIKSIIDRPPATEAYHEYELWLIRNELMQAEAVNQNRKEQRCEYTEGSTGGE